MDLLGLRNWLRQQMSEYGAGDITDAELNEHINRAYADFAARSGALQKDITISVGANISEVTLPQYVAGVLSANWQTAATKLLRARIQQLENTYGVGWRTQTGTPRYYVQLSPSNLLLVPKTGSTFSDTLQIVSVVVPSSITGAPYALLSADTDKPALPEPYHLALGYYSLFEIASRDPSNRAQMARASMWARVYLSMAEAAKKSQGTALQDYVPPIPPLPIETEQQGR